MKIETKFEIDEKVVTIDNNSIVILPVIGIEYVFKRIRYTLLKYKAVNFGDKNGVTIKDEDECFKSIKELAEYYENKQNG